MAGKFALMKEQMRRGRKQRWLSGSYASHTGPDVGTAVGRELYNTRLIQATGCIHSGGRGAQVAFIQCLLSVSQRSDLKECRDSTNGEFWKVRVKLWPKDRQTTNIK